MFTQMTQITLVSLVLALVASPTFGAPVPSGTSASDVSNTIDHTAQVPANEGPELEARRRKASFGDIIQGIEDGSEIIENGADIFDSLFGRDLEARRRKGGKAKGKSGDGLDFSDVLGAVADTSDIISNGVDAVESIFSRDLEARRRKGGSGKGGIDFGDLLGKVADGSDILANGAEVFNSIFDRDLEARSPKGRKGGSKGGADFGEILSGIADGSDAVASAISSLFDRDNHASADQLVTGDHHTPRDNHAS